MDRRQLAALKRKNRLEKRISDIGATLTFGTANKFNAINTTYRGEKYASLGEAECAAWLDWRVAAGELVTWERGRSFVLQKGKHGVDKLTYKPDFYAIPVAPQDGGVFRRPFDGGYWIDYKGGHITETEAFKIRVKLWRRNVRRELRIVTKNRDGWQERVICPAFAMPACPECDTLNSEILPGGVVWFDEQGRECNRLVVACENGHRFMVNDAGGEWQVME